MDSRTLTAAVDGTVHALAVTRGTGNDSFEFYRALGFRAALAALRSDGHPDAKVLYDRLDAALLDSQSAERDRQLDDLYVAYPESRREVSA